MAKNPYGTVKQNVSGTKPRGGNPLAKVKPAGNGSLNRDTQPTASGPQPKPLGYVKSGKYMGKVSS